MAQPPGNETFASPCFANSGPRTMIDALMVLTSSYDANFDSIPLALNAKEPLSFFFIFIPMESNKVIIVLTSARSGMPLRVMS